METEITKLNLQSFVNTLQDELEKTPSITVDIKKSSGTGNWGMSRLWRAWMQETANFMSRNGVTMPLMISSTGEAWGKRPFDKDDAHALFTSEWLGTDEKGDRLSWSRKGRDGLCAASKGERFDALRKHQAWAIEKGLILINPRDSEYFKMSQEGNY